MNTAKVPSDLILSDSKLWMFIIYALEAGIEEKATTENSAAFCGKHFNKSEGTNCPLSWQS